ncbi:MerR family DNA-binding protein [Alteromonas sp. MB-3u-76]|uniref:MerR family DNA-binding protein n=1 Tax=Alteromonas sp. MB-3u-76 TaxID=2058133 RepID=UPI002FC2BB5D
MNAGITGRTPLKRLKFIRAARAAGLLVVDIKPLLMAIDAGERKVPEDIQKLLLTKIEHRKVFLNLVTNQIEEFCN